MATPSGGKLGTPLRGGPGSAAPPPPPPVIPTTILQPHEQRLVVFSLFGLLELIKVWDILSPYFIPSPEPTWSSQFRLSTPSTFLGWLLLELLAFSTVSLLRIPLISPSPRQLLSIGALLVGWNLGGWLVAEPGGLLTSVNLLGPAALGGGGVWRVWYALENGFGGEKHLEGVHKIRLLPFSTATLNPLSMSYCIPPDSSSPLYIPILFNNSLPDEVSYYVRSLDTGHAEVKTVASSQMKRPPGRRLAIKDQEEDEDDASGESEVDPLSAVVLRNQETQLDTARLPSVKPSDSLALVPQKLEQSQSILFLTVDKPAVVSLKAVTDRRGDRFRITPHREAIIIECPTGGHFVDGKGEHKKKKGDKPRPIETRCVGEEDVVHFEARGVSPLKVGWRKKSKDGGAAPITGVIEGIEDEIESVDDQLALVRRDKVSQTHTVPLRVAHDAPGTYTVSLTHVSDAMHNAYTPTGHSSEQVYTVLARPSVRFDCRGTKELYVGKTTTIPIVLDTPNTLTTPLEATYSFTPADGSPTSTHSITLSKRSEVLTATQPGLYTLLDLSGTCPGPIIEPSTCSVVLIPPPTVEMSVETLHECAQDVGSTARFEFTGTPPFLVEWTEKRKGGGMRKSSHEERKRRRFEGFEGVVVLQPEMEGEYTYTFTSMSDKKYTSIPLTLPPITQTVHPLASLELVSPPTQTLFSCSGDIINLEIDAKGEKPLKINYLVSSGGKSENVTVAVEPGRSVVKVPVPEELRKAGREGKVKVLVGGVEDGKGCVRRLSGRVVDVEVNRQKPTARFAKGEKIIITEGDTARAQLRLTGEAPWEVAYSVNGGKEKKVTMRDANNHLTFAEKGVYRLNSVRDRHCPGDIVDAESVFEIDFKPRPTVNVVESSTLKHERSVYKHKGLCAGQEDQVALKFSGQSPFELAYRYTADGKTSRHVLKSAQETGILHLATEPGQHRYDLLDLKDTNYPSTPVSLAVEHDVHSRPSGTWTKHSSQSLCLDQPLKASDARLHLVGKAPFHLDLSVRKPASTRFTEYSISTKSHEWSLDLPHQLTDVGRYEVILTRVADASGCEWEVREGDRLSTTVEVVESARIVPVGHEADLCVGDTLEFLLQGKAPWTVEYEWLGKKHKVTEGGSRFSRYAEEEGVFEVKSVALRNNQCKREIHNLARRVHPLPRVRIQDGVNDLHEGDEPVAFSVQLRGTPPFSFTYTRSETVNGRSRIVDTQTVTDIEEEVYTISSSEPGDYAVTSVSDKNCRYPPIAKRKDG